MQRIINITARPGSILHAKPLPLTAPWPDDAITATESAEFPGNYELDLIAGVKYIVYYGSADSFVNIDADERHQRIRASITADLAADDDTPVLPGIYRVDVSVVSAGSLIPLGGAVVRIDSQSASDVAATDLSGETFFFAAAGSYVLSVNALGHKITHTTIEVTSDTSVQITPSLIADAQIANNVTRASAICYTGNGEFAVNKTYQIRLTRVDDNNDEIGEIYSLDPFEVTSDSTGLLDINLLKNASYVIQCLGSTRQVKFKTDDFAFFAIPDIHL